MSNNLLPQFSSAKHADSQDKRPTIGFLTDRNSGSQQVGSGVVDAARAHDVNVLCFAGGRLGEPDDFAAQANILYELINVREFAGLIIQTTLLELLPGQDDMEKFLERFRSLPIVTISKAFPGIPAILTDNARGIDEAIRHLSETHHCRRIAFIRGPEYHTEARERYAAYVNALQKYGLPFDPNLISPSCTNRSEASLICSRLLDKHHPCPGSGIDAVIAPDREILIQIHSILKSRGILIPDDIALVGCDDVPETEAFMPPVTTVNPRFYELGRQSLETLLALISGEPVPDTIVLPADLIVRESCGCLNPVVLRSASEPVHIHSKTPASVAACRHEILAARQTGILQELGARFIATFDVMELMNVLAENIPLLEIPGCYVALYEELQIYEYSQPAPQQSRLILAYQKDEEGVGKAVGQIFPSSQLVPEGVFPQTRPYAMAVKALYFRTYQIGFVLFEIARQDDKLYEFLRRQISSALYGLQLLRRAEARATDLARQKYILDTFMENIPDAIYFKDLDSRIFYSNKAHARYLGQDSPEDVIGKTDFDYFPEEQARNKYEQEQEIIRTGQPLLAVEEPHDHNQWLLTTKMPLRDERGEIIGTFGMSRNITELKRTQHELAQYRDHLEQLVEARTGALQQANALLHQQIMEGLQAQQALRMSEQQYRLLAESVQEGILIVQAGKLVFANEVFTKMVDYSVEQLMDINPIALFRASTDPIVHDRLVYGDNESPERWQTELVTKEGQTIWVEIAQNPMVWNSELALLLTLRNVTERKRREHLLEEERSRLERENLNLKSTIKERYRFGALIGKSSAMQRVYELLISAATSDVNVLIFGESGTGKELIARTLHQLSPRKNQAFVSVNCASIPETLFEREFFGHHKGAFTGAERNRPGLFDRAHQGVLFLDEVTELGPGAQAKLLRVLQNGEYLPLGSTFAKTANVQIVAATNQEPHTLIEQGRLRKDFFYRIGVIEIAVPALRERKDDLPLLIEHILEQYRQRQNTIHRNTADTLPTDQSMLPPELVQALYTYHWPGNVRELQNLLQRYLATRDMSSILSLIATPEARRTTTPAQPDTFSGQSLAETVKQFEKRRIADMLAINHYNIRKTAEMLQVPLRTLYYKIRIYHLRDTENS